MTSATNMVYFIYLSNHHHNKKVGLVYDTASSHCSKVVIDYVSKWNDDSEYSCDFLLIHV